MISESDQRTVIWLMVLQKKVQRVFHEELVETPWFIFPIAALKCGSTSSKRIDRSLKINHAMVAHRKLELGEIWSCWESGNE